MGPKYITPVFSTEDVSAFNDKVSAMDMARELINAQNLDYQLLAQNSNSGAETLLQAANLSLNSSDMSGLYTPGRNNLLVDVLTLTDLQNVADGGQLSTGLSLAYDTLRSIGNTLDTWARDYGFTITLDEVLNASGRWGGMELYAAFLDLGISEPHALAYMVALEEDLQELEKIAEEHDLGDSFIQNVAENAAKANEAIQHAAFFLTPLAVDLDGDGVETIGSLVNGDVFDFGDGAVTAHGWLSGDDGFVALDANANGLIDSSQELFGSQSLDGFSSLAIHDDNGDGKIDAQDAVFADLKIWQDKNENGVTDAGELTSLTNHGISSLSLQAQYSDETDNGNLIALQSEGSYSDGTTFELSDVYFRTLRGEGTPFNAVTDDSSKLILGTKGNDIISGNETNQFLRGDVGNDVFTFAGEFGNDEILDFEIGVDGIAFENICLDTVDGLQLENGYQLSVGSNTVLLQGVILESNWSELLV